MDLSESVNLECVISKTDEVCDREMIIELVNSVFELQARHETLIAETAALLKKLYKGFRKLQLILSELRKSFDLVKQQISCEGLKEQMCFEKKLIAFLKEEATKSTKIDNICMWIETEFFKVNSGKDPHKLDFLSALVSAVIYSSMKSYVEDKECYLLDEDVFRHLAPILHRFFTEVDVAASQVLILYIQDWVNIHGKYPKSLLDKILIILFENKKFLSFVDGVHREAAVLLMCCFPEISR